MPLAPANVRFLRKADALQGARIQGGVMSVAVFETVPQFAGDSSFSHKLDYLDSCAPAIKFPFLLRLRIMFQRRRMTNETRWHLKAPAVAATPILKDAMVVTGHKSVTTSGNLRLDLRTIDVGRSIAVV